MKNKFIRTLSPITLIIILAFDCASIAGLISAISKIREAYTTINILYLLIIIFAFVVAIFVTKEIFSHGVKFREDEMEFTALDNDNIFKYEDIDKVETQKDEKVSLVKNFVDRHSIITIYLKDEQIVTVDIGLTKRNTLKKINTQIHQRINKGL